MKLRSSTKEIQTKYTKREHFNTSIAVRAKYQFGQEDVQ